MTTPDHVLPAPATARDPDAEGGSIVAPRTLETERRGSIAFLSHTKREGSWTLPPHYRGLSMMGNLELDLSRAHIGPGTSHIELRSIIGSITVRVPHHVRVECDCDPLMGSVEVRRKGRSAASPDAPLVLITGAAILGSIEIIVEDPDAPGWFERVRARWIARKR